MLLKPCLLQPFQFIQPPRPSALPLDYPPPRVAVAFVAAFAASVVANALAVAVAAAAAPAVGIGKCQDMLQESSSDAHHPTPALPRV